MLASYNNILFFLPSFVPFSLFCRQRLTHTIENMSSTFFKPCITPESQTYKATTH